MITCRLKCCLIHTNSFTSTWSRVQLRTLEAILKYIIKARCAESLAYVVMRSDILGPTQTKTEDRLSESFTQIPLWQIKPLQDAYRTVWVRQSGSTDQSDNSSSTDTHSICFPLWTTCQSLYTPSRKPPTHTAKDLSSDMLQPKDQINKSERAQINHVLTVCLQSKHKARLLHKHTKTWFHTR